VCRDAGWTAPSALIVVGLIMVALIMVVIVIVLALIMVVLIIVALMMMVIVIGVVLNRIANPSMSGRGYGCHRAGHQEAAGGARTPPAARWQG
jgi:hypothetical protein